MKRLILVGSVYPEGFLREIKGKCTYVDYAADNFQRALIKGLSSHIDNIMFITYPVFRAPFSKLLRKKGVLYDESAMSKTTLLFTGFLNFPFVKMIDETIRVYKALKEVLYEENNDVLVYGLHSPFLCSVLLLKKQIRRAGVVIPDLPEFMGGGNGVFYKIAKTIDRYIINKCLRRFDCFTILSPYMKEQLPIKDKPCAIVEGIYTEQNDVNITNNKAAGINILYSGLISKRYGVFDLIKAFSKLVGNNYSLWLCGVCSTSDKVLLDELIIKDSRIKYFGSLSVIEARRMQREASLLVNPRHSNEEYTKYSFPSKTMEYLASGTPTVMCKLLAIPQEYNDFLFYFTEESIDGYASKMDEIVHMDSDYLLRRGESGRAFILKEKNEVVQTAKIVELFWNN